MKYIKLKGSDYKDVLLRLRKEYGDDAIPISHKFVKEGGVFNSHIFGKKVVELTAAVQERKGLKKLTEEHKKIDVTIGDESEPNEIEALLRKDSSPVNSGYNRIKDLQESVDSINTTLTESLSRQSLKKRSTSGERVKAEPVTEGFTGHSTPTEKFEKEFEEIRSALSLLLDKNDTVETVNEDDALDSFKTLLEKNDFFREEAQQILKDMKRNVGPGEMTNRFSIEKNFKDLVKSKIVTSGPIDLSRGKSIVMVIGPTGVGKTTTMAKLGAIYSLKEKKKVTFITIDNYRIAATEQLKKYATIMNINFHSIANQEEFKKVLEKDTSDIVLIDTSGRSHRNEIKISELKSFADATDRTIERILCVSATTKRNDLDDVFRAFEAMDVDSVVITKVDETSFIGNVVTVADKYNKPISYITNGQEVPNDIAVATNDSLVELMMGDDSL